MPRVLELFSGTASIGRAFQAAAFCCDILLWDFRATFSPGYFQFIWASPVCTEYSRALTTRPRRLLEGDALVLRTIEIIAYFEPVMRAIENPAPGLLGTPYRKQTRLWTNMLWRPSRKLCKSGNRCDAWVDGRHRRAAQRGPRLLGNRYERVCGQSRELLYSIPAVLCDEIAQAATTELAEWV